MNINTSRHQHRESKHSRKPTTMEAASLSALCRIPQQQQRQPLFSYSYNTAQVNGKYHHHHHRDHHHETEAEDAVRSQSIPICQTALRRTTSELKLSEDEATADFQDYVFFSRLLTGISKQQQYETVSPRFLRESDECLAHIIGTRNGSVDDSLPPHISSSATENVLLYHPSQSEEAKEEDEDDEGIFSMDI